MTGTEASRAAGYVSSAMERQDQRPVCGRTRFLDGAGHLGDARGAAAGR